MGIEEVEGERWCEDGSEIGEWGSVWRVVPSPSVDENDELFLRVRRATLYIASFKLLTTFHCLSTALTAKGRV